MIPAKIRLIPNEKLFFRYYLEEIMKGRVPRVLVQIIYCIVKLYV